MLDKIKLHLAEPEMCPLNDVEMKYWGVLKLAFTLLCETFSPEKTIESLQQFQRGLTYEAGLGIVKDAQLLYGDAMGWTKRIGRAVMRQKLGHLAEEARAANNIEEQRKCLEMIAKLDNLFTPDAEDPDVHTRFPAPVFTSDAKVLEIEAEEE